VLLLPFGPLTRLRAEVLHEPARMLLPAFAVAVVVAVAGLLLLDLPFKAVAGMLGGGWVIAGTIAFFWQRRRERKPFTREMIGMMLAHVGVGVFVIGVLVTQATSIERDVAMSPGDSIEVAGYTFRFDGSDHREGPNFAAEYGTVTVLRDDREILVMHPEKRSYRNNQVMTEVSIDPGFTRDIYVALGEAVDENGGWAVRVYHKPFIRWIWLGALMMMLGGFWTAADRRFAAKRQANVATNGKVPA